MSREQDEEKKKPVPYMCTYDPEWRYLGRYYTYHTEIRVFIAACIDIGAYA